MNISLTDVADDENDGLTKANQQQTLGNKNHIHLTLNKILRICWEKVINGIRITKMTMMLKMNSRRKLKSTINLHWLILIKKKGREQKANKINDGIF